MGTYMYLAHHETASENTHHLYHLISIQTLLLHKYTAT